MFKATKEIYEALVAHGLTADIKEDENCSMVSAGFPLECSAPFTMRFMNADDDNDTAVRVDLMRIPEEKRGRILPILNDFNNRFRYAKFTLNKENDVFVEYDFPLQIESAGECAKEMLARFVNIIGDCHGVLLLAALTPQDGTMYS